MDRYTELLRKAVRQIEHTYKKRDLGGLFAGSGTRSSKVTKVSERIQSVEDFELISWLVLR